MDTATDTAPAAETDTATHGEATNTPAPPRATTPRTLSIRLSTALTGLVIVALAVAAAVFGGLYASAQSTLDQRDATAAADQHAEDVATGYAVGAATIDYHDVDGWLARLKANTTPQLAAKFDATRPQLEQIVLPLQMTSKATPLSAAVTGESGGIYKVNVYINLDSTNAQTPDGAQTTVTYSLTLDRGQDWKITDVGSQNVLPTK